MAEPGSGTPDPSTFPLRRSVKNEATEATVGQMLCCPAVLAPEGPQTVISLPSRGGAASNQPSDLGRLALLGLSCSHLGVNLGWQTCSIGEREIERHRDRERGVVVTGEKKANSTAFSDLHMHVLSYTHVQLREVILPAMSRPHTLSPL